MRQLHRLIFINSANIPYAEIPLDGNVHFIGTQGVGKSTILRAILFFYNADTQKLGIPTEKTSFPFYYLEYENSYIIYEVQTDKIRYCIWAFKSQNRVNYRFIDSNYQQEFFIENNSSKLPNDVMQGLNAKGIGYSKKKIEKYADYRDIIYGNAKREFRKYAILESQLYQNIPRTISNVFLNSKLEASFIKKTIISSITEDNESISIDLQSIRKSLSVFQKSYDDVLLFNKHEKLGQRIVRTYHEVRENEGQLKQTAYEIGTALDIALKALHSLSKRLNKENNQLNELKKELGLCQQQYDHNAQNIRDKIAILNSDIQRANRKITLYKKENIEFKLELNGQETYLKERKETTIKEQEILLTQYKSIDEQFQKLLSEVELSKQGVQRIHEGKKNDLKGDFLKKKEKLNEQQEATLDSARKQFKTARQELLDELETANHNVQQQQEQVYIIQNTMFFQTELEAIQQQIKTKEGKIQGKKFNLANKENELKLFETEAFRKVEALDKQSQSQQETFQNNIAAHQQQLSVLEQQIDDYEDTLYGFLDNTNSEWRSTIGKVFKDEILKRTDLNPKFKNIKEQFYGLKIDLSLIEQEAKGYADFIQERNILTTQLQEDKKAFKKFNEAYQEEKTNLVKRNNQNIRSFRKDIERIEIELQQLNNNIEQLKAQHLDWKDKSSSEYQMALSKQNELLKEAKQIEKELKVERKKLNKKEDENLKTTKATYKKYIIEEQKRYQANLKKLQHNLDTQLQELKTKEEEINKQRQNRLGGEGANTSQIEAVEASIKGFKNQLATIKKNKSLINDYQKDKRELLDKLPYFNETLQNNNQSLEALKEQFQKIKKQFQSAIDAQEQTIKNVEKEKQRIDLALESFNKEFKTGTLYQRIKHWIENPIDVAPKTRDIGILRASILSISDKIEEISNQLKQLINRYKSHFSEDNSFGLNVNLSNDSAYQAFANKLEEVFVESLITHLESETEKHFNQIITEITAQTESLTSKKSEIERIINKINQDFRNGNFVDAIQKIELKTGDSHNRIVQALMAIQAYKDENPMISYGASNNLFAALEKKITPNKAVKLLERLSEELKKATVTQIELADSFELEFRVEENNNDTGWVSRIANVGSNGTDVLVKAMVYIMLLNVFKNKASKKVKDFRIHCIIDEVGILHDSNLKGLVKFANERNIILINGSPNPNDVAVYKYTLLLTKNNNRQTQVVSLIANP